MFRKGERLAVLALAGLAVFLGLACLLWAGGAQAQAKAASIFSFLIPSAPNTGSVGTLTWPYGTIFAGQVDAGLILAPSIGINMQAGRTPGQAFEIDDGNQLFQGGGETSIQFKRNATVGTASNPIFAFGRIIAGGINLPDWRVLYSDDTHAEYPIWSQESSGTVATIADNQLRSMWESYEFNGQVDPMVRLNMFTGVAGAGFQYEMGRVGCQSAVGGMVRTGGNLVTVTCGAANSFVTGDTVNVGFITADANFAAGAFTVTVTDSTHFTYAQAGSNVSSAQIGAFSVATDSALRSSGKNESQIVVGPFGSYQTASRFHGTTTGAVVGLPTIPTASLPACTASTWDTTHVGAGAEVHDSTTNTVAHCNGTAWKHVTET